jgi:hypothetical protein
MVMHPSPISETSSPRLPSFHFCIATSATAKLVRAYCGAQSGGGQEAGGHGERISAACREGCQAERANSMRETGQSSDSNTGLVSGMVQSSEPSGRPRPSIWCAGRRIRTRQSYPTRSAFHGFNHKLSMNSREGSSPARAETAPRVRCAKRVEPGAAGGTRPIFWSNPAPRDIGTSSPPRSK